MIRAFVAVDLSDELKEAYAGCFEAARAVQSELRWVRPENLHLTLKFLGDTAEDGVEPLRRTLAPVAASHGPVPLSLGSPGCFGPPERPRVLWFSIERGADRLKALARDVDAALRALGLRLERQPWRAHLTVARNPRGVRWSRWRDFLHQEGLCGRSFEAREITFFSSMLGSRGPSYTSLWHVPLEGESADCHHESQ